MEKIIWTENVTKKYNNIFAVRNANITFRQNTFYAIKGHSGSGKTTLINMLGLLDDPTTGEIYISNTKASHLTEDEKAKMRMKQFGFVFQAFYLNEKLKSYENVMVPMYINPSYKNVNIKNKAITLLETMGLTDRINHFPRQLSAGEQQRVAIARALANDPLCIIADEPTGNLDEKNEILILDVLKTLVQNRKTVIVVTHNKIIEKYADELFIMSEGNIEVM
jgi:ABC-type lipoprotein export system ATPase subunit